jgi:hypothetical protein
MSRLPSKRLGAISVNVELAFYSGKTVVIRLDCYQQKAVIHLWSDGHLANPVVPRSLQILVLDEDGREKGVSSTVVALFTMKAC